MPQATHNALQQASLPVPMIGTRIAILMMFGATHRTVSGKIIGGSADITEGLRVQLDVEAGDFGAPVVLSIAQQHCSRISCGVMFGCDLFLNLSDAK